MGIRFRCHHCEHELHVKDFQGGKRGRCPDCQGKFRIPLRDAEYSLDPDEASGFDEAPVDTAQLSSTRTQPIPASQPVTSHPVPDTPAAGKPTVHSPSSRPASSATKPAGPVEAPISESVPHSAPPAPPPAAAEASQPQALLDAPQAEWFVRPPSGGQYGPAPGDSMWQWLCENRISRDSLVWCDGWPEWLVASQVFSDYFANNNLDDSIVPSLASAVAAVAPGVAVTESSTAISGEAQPTSLGDRNRAGRKQRRKRNYTVLIAILSVVMIVLIVALVIVLTNQQSTA